MDRLQNTTKFQECCDEAMQNGMCNVGHVGKLNLIYFSSSYQEKIVNIYKHLTSHTFVDPLLKCNL